MMKSETGKTLLVAFLLCIVCSILVSGAAVSLKPMQEANKKLDVKKNLLIASGLVDGNATKADVDAAYKNVQPLLVDLATGDVIEGDIENYDQKKAAKDPKQNLRIDAAKDLGNIKFRAKVAKAYLVKDAGEVSMIVLPVHGKGLWSTMYGFLALAPDTVTVKGIGFYSHGETPGLGGEIDNPSWKATWNGKKALDESFSPILKVVKGAARTETEIDGLSGATLTAVGVTGTIQYWLGDDAFGPFLAKFREGGIK
ncbi:NADH:ubiquinone reductase (Na(+)-transporting) subunit C [Halobacteriovorax marinus]|uniref:Na(+)-translocating NADH-quinone reductase subunit C n=2 Tax=Halobacteriovorax marinus TaxID=97084 RepID=E1X4A2_HALMS|nr:NADH:ubiquinone reductase (Na(+)-transporting) subunit C [Halobacteriovorax marinus]CBW27074.1 Na+-translocating NADH-quinone reductase subunit C [Halobacteriovorax marinus SJ]